MSDCLALVVEVGECENLSRVVPLEHVHAALESFQVLHLVILRVVFTHSGTHHHFFLLFFYIVLHVFVLRGLSFFLVLHVCSVANHHFS